MWKFFGEAAKNHFYGEKVEGKTTAALGMALRAAGHGLKVCFIQFIKGSWKYGEREAVKQLEGENDVFILACSTRP